MTIEAAVIGGCALLALIRYKIGIMKVIGGAGVLGYLLLLLRS